jgi:hypothetical protein
LVACLGCISTELSDERELPVCALQLEARDLADAVLQVNVEAPGLFTVCNGIVIAPNLVLTAANCVAVPVVEFDFSVPSCMPSGAPVEDGSFEYRYSQVVDPAAVQLQGSGEVLTHQITEIFMSAAYSSCMPDLALLRVLPALDAPRVPLRLEGAIAADEAVTISGFDVTTGTAELHDLEATVAESTGETGTASLPPRSLRLSGEACTFEGGAVLARTTSALVGIILQSDRSINCMAGSGTPVALQLAPFREFLLETARHVDAPLFAESGPQRTLGNIPDCQQ